MAHRPPPLGAAVNTAPLSVSREAGNPCRAAASSTECPELPHQVRFGPRRFVWKHLMVDALDVLTGRGGRQVRHLTPPDDGDVVFESQIFVFSVSSSSNHPQRHEAPPEPTTPSVRRALLTLYRRGRARRCPTSRWAGVPLTSSAAKPYPRWVWDAGWSPRLGAWAPIFWRNARLVLLAGRLRSDQLFRAFLTSPSASLFISRGIQQNRTVLNLAANSITVRCKC